MEQRQDFSGAVYGKKSQNKEKMFDEDELAISDDDDGDEKVDDFSMDSEEELPSPQSKQ